MYILLGTLLPYTCIALFLLRLVGCKHCALWKLLALLLCDSLSTPQLVFRANRHSLGSFFSLQLVRTAVPFVESTVTSCFVKTTVQSASHMCPTPTSVLVKEGMMYPVVGKSDANWGMGSVSFADEFSICPLAVLTLIVDALMSGRPCGADGAM